MSARYPSSLTTSNVVEPSLPTGNAETLRLLEAYWLDFVHLPGERR